MGVRGVWLVTLLTAVALAEVIILKSVQYMYDHTPELRIHANGFENVDVHDILLDISATGQPSLRIGKDYLLFKNPNGGGIILKLLSARRWAYLEGRAPPVALVLSKVAFKQSPDKNLLPASESIIVAQVLETPTASESVDVIYTTATNELRIKGTGFAGAKGVDFYFDPPLYKEVGYEVVTRFPTIENQITLRLRHRYKWRDEPGPLKLVGIDTGGGPVKLNGEDGVIVATVQADVGSHGVTVDSTAGTQQICSDQSEIVVKGEGFNPLGNTLSWANGLLPRGVNYTTLYNNETSITLRLNPGSHWLAPASVPGFLTLLAVNAGEGFVAVGPTEAKLGARIARVSCVSAVPSNPSPPSPAHTDTPPRSSSHEEALVLTVPMSTVYVFTAGTAFGAALILLVLHLLPCLAPARGAQLHAE